IAAPDIAQQHGAGIDVVNRDIEETLDLVSVQIHGHDAINADNLQHIGYDLGRDRHTCRTWATILAGITEIRNGSCNTTCRSTTQRIDHHHDFHEIVVGGCAGRLQYENVFTADVLVDFHHDFAIRKATYGHFPQGHIEVIGDIHCQTCVGSARKN